MSPKEIRTALENNVNAAAPESAEVRDQSHRHHRGHSTRYLSRATGSRASCPGLRFSAAVPNPEEVSDMIDRVTLMPVLSTTKVPLMMVKNSKVVPVKAVPVFAVVASARAGVQGCFSPRAPLSTCLLPEVPAKAALVQEDSVTAASEDPLTASVFPPTAVIPP